MGPSGPRLPVIHPVTTITNAAIAGRLAKMSLEIAIEAIGDIGNVGAAGKIIRGPVCPAGLVPVSLSSVKYG
jgi:hypothetical protein